MPDFERPDAPLQMCYLGHPVLRETAQPVDAITDEIKQLANDMIATMQAHDGIGLAGNQIGRPLRIVALDVPPPRPDDAPFLSPGERLLLPRMPLVIINPELSEFSDDSADYCEGCLSIPGVTGDVDRSTTLRLRAQIVGAEKVDLPCGGLLARCLMHEQDHLDGKLFIDYLSQQTLKPFRAKMKQLTSYTDKQLRRQTP